MRVILSYMTTPQMNRGRLEPAGVMRMRQVISVELVKKICIAGNSPDGGGGDVYVAGGAAVFCLNGFVNKDCVGDVDVFVCNANIAAFRKGIELVDKTIKAIRLYKIDKRGRAKTSGVVTIMCKKEYFDIGVPIQFVLSPYSIERTIMAFDIDASQCAFRYDDQTNEFHTLKTPMAALAHATRTLRIFRDIDHPAVRFKARIENYMDKGFTLPDGVDSLDNMQLSMDVMGRHMSIPRDYERFLKQKFVSFAEMANGSKRWEKYRRQKNMDTKYEAIFQSAELNRLPWDAIEPIEQAANRNDPEKKHVPLYVYIADRRQLYPVNIPCACIVVTHPVDVVYSKYYSK